MGEGTVTNQLQLTISPPSHSESLERILSFVLHLPATTDNAQLTKINKMTKFLMFSKYLQRDKNKIEFIILSHSNITLHPWIGVWLNQP